MAPCGSAAASAVPLRILAAIAICFAALVDCYTADKQKPLRTAQKPDFQGRFETLQNG
jgi:hypothetical protein